MSIGLSTERAFWIFSLIGSPLENFVREINRLQAEQQLEQQQQQQEQERRRQRQHHPVSPPGAAGRDAVESALAVAER
jgi:hypothetical protein